MTAIEIRGERSNQLLEDGFFLDEIEIIKQQQFEIISAVSLNNPQELVEPVAVLKAIDLIVGHFVSLVQSGKSEQRPKPKVA
jgi:hypothetical protein